MLEWAIGFMDGLLLILPAGGAASRPCALKRPNDPGFSIAGDPVLAVLHPKSMLLEVPCNDVNEVIIRAVF